MRHYQRKTDKNHCQITAFLRGQNCHVIDLSSVGSGVPDLLVLTPDRRLILMEIKNPDGGRLTPKQRELMEVWPVAVVRNPNDCLTAIGNKTNSVILESQ
jgi:hypothetical protein